MRLSIDTSTRYQERYEDSAFIVERKFRSRFCLKMAQGKVKGPTIDQFIQALRLK